eukprot:TRINITY_DN6893_c0_g1_i12.p1 TRINITY_DN6893_c0_g1~~TRINITY_DN6893_c0_g1_i12.p1  ORF type:complete len:441 (+),score=110.30 TRINITY_DN6893_c0_g1_i12:80-1402(+)
MCIRDRNIRMHISFAQISNMKLYTWVDQVISLFTYANDVNNLYSLLSLTSGKTIAELSSLSRSSKHLSNLRFSIATTLGLPQEHSITNTWNDFLSSHLVFLGSRARGESAKVLFESYNESFGFFVKVFKIIQEGDWSAPLVKWFCNELYELAEQADEDPGTGNKRSVQYDEAVRSIQQLFAACQLSNFKFPQCKLYSVLFCINTLFKIFFKLEKIQSCQTLLKWYAQNKTTVILAAYPKSAQVTFHYFRGRMALYQMDFVEAEEALDFALAHCPKNAFNNRLLIVRYLTPAKLVLGTYPEEELLKRYRLKEYISISRAIRSGDIGKFNEELEKYEELYVSKGVYLIMERLRYVTYRNLFKKIQRIVNPADKIMKLDKFNQVLAIGSSEKVDPLETECILANMIDRKLLLGYLIHEKQLIVMSKKKEIFPPIRAAYTKSES